MVDTTTIRLPNSWQDSVAFRILSVFDGNLLVIAAESDDVIPVDVGGKIHASAINAKVRFFHIVPGLRHLSLFPREQDFFMVLNMITEKCRGGRTTHEGEDELL